MKKHPQNPTMPDSGTKLPQNGIHLFDPVGLINDEYGGYRASNSPVQPTRVIESYDHSDHNNNGNKSDVDIVGVGYEEIPMYTVDPVEVQSKEIPMYTAVTVADRGYDHGVKELKGGVLRFGVDVKAEDEYDVNPRLFKPVSTTSPKAIGSPLNPTRPRSVNSSPLHPSSSKAMGSPLNPTYHRSANSSPFHPSSPKAMGSPLNPISPKPTYSSPLNPTSPRSANSFALHPTSPKYPGSPLHPNHHHHRPMSPNSRTQAIARGRKELMDMVRDLPETYYELSLKDIVERKADAAVQKELDPPEEKRPVKETIKPEEKDKKSSKKVEKSGEKKMARSKSIDNEKFLLKTSVFPILLGSKKKKKSMGASGSFKIAPIPKPQPTPTRPMKGPEKEWWRRRPCVSSESDESNGLSSSSRSSGSSRSSSRSNSNSNSNTNRHSSRFLPSCCFFSGRSLKRIKDKK